MAQHFLIPGFEDIKREEGVREENALRQDDHWNGLGQRHLDGNSKNHGPKERQPRSRKQTRLPARIEACRSLPVAADSVASFAPGLAAFIHQEIQRSPSPPGRFSGDVKAGPARWNGREPIRLVMVGRASIARRPGGSFPLNKMRAPGAGSTLGRRVSVGESV